MAVTRRGFLLGSASFAAMTAASAWTHGSAAVVNSNTVVNFFAGSGENYRECSYLNVAKTMNWGSSESGWPAHFSAAGNYPGNLTFSTNPASSVFLDPGYYDHWTISWSGAGTLATLNDHDIIVYSGGTFTSLGTASGELGGNAFITGTNASVEFAFGFLLKAVSSSGGLVQFTVNRFNSFDLGTGARVKFNHVTGLPAGPNPDGSWTINDPGDFNTFTLQGSGAFVGLVSITGAGGPGTQSEAIYSYATKNSVALTGAYSSFTNLRWYKTAQAADFSATGVNGATGLLASREAISTVRAMGPPAYLRFMDNIGTLNTTWPAFAQRPLPGDITWGLFQNPLALWGGVLTQVGDAYTAANPSASPASGAYQDGEVVIAQIGTANVGFSPTLAITGRAGAAPIYNGDCTQINLVFSGSLPSLGATITLSFTGGGVSGTQNYTYTTTAGDTSFGALAANIRADFNANPSGHSSAMLAAGMACLGQGLNGSLMQFANSPNKNFSGTTGLGISTLSISGSDSSGHMTITPAFVDAGYLVSNTVGVFVFSTLVQGWISKPGDSGTNTGGVNGGPPLEYLEEVCARCGSGLWYNVPTLASSGDITSAVSHIASATYNGSFAVKTLALEWANEIWNTNDPTGIAQTFGNALGLPGSQYSTHALRNIQMAQLAQAAWVAAGRSRSDLKIVGTYQFVRITDFQTTYWNGGDLNCAGAGNAILKAFGGLGQTTMPSVNYSAAPNRPVDFCDWISPAPYWTGSLFNSAGGFTQISPLSTYDNLFLSAWNFAYGNSAQKTAALDFCYNIGSGTGDFYSTNQPIVNQFAFLPALWALGSGQPSAGYFGIGTFCASYDSSRSGTGTGAGAQLKLGVGCYEGGWFMNPTNAAQFQGGLNGYYTLNYASGLPGAAANPGGVTDDFIGMSALIFNLLLAWKNDARAAAMVAKQFADFKAAVNSVSTRDALMAWYGFEGASNFGQWDTSVTAGNPYQAYNAIAAFR